MTGFALQLYTMRDPAREDLRGTLERVRAIGYEYVQWSGMPDLPAPAIRKELDAAGLKAVAGHVGVESFEQDFDAAVAHWKTIGAADIAPGGMMGDCTGSREAWLRGAKRLDSLGARLRDVGMRLSYHNHNWEFETFPGDERCKLDILYAETDPRNLYAEIDTAWVRIGGSDPASYLRKYAGRCPVIHVKDVHPESSAESIRFAELGEGILDWPGIFAAGREAGVEWYIYEQDTCDDPFESARVSFEFLNRNLT